MQAYIMAPSYEGDSSLTLLLQLNLKKGLIYEMQAIFFHTIHTGTCIGLESPLPLVGLHLANVSSHMNAEGS